MLSVKEAYARLAPVFSALPPLEGIANQRLMLNKFIENREEDRRLIAEAKAKGTKPSVPSEKVEIGIKDDSSNFSKKLQETSKDEKKDLNRRQRNREALQHAQQAQAMKQAAINAALKGDSSGLDAIREKEFHSANLRARGYTVKDDVKRLKKTVQQDRRGRNRGAKKPTPPPQKQKAGFSRRRAPLN
ncbi:hypothetical protein GMRT_10189 [Giardia muris]|uniref:Ribosomal RNA-processing protein 14/surfeit locus protein 6 C-terminal domain-containing protein n=1 Tax=Giardia muris TaxID=5742 RepID=A0A4Z1SYJ8_GIAMU|nr:hypothetical protein GMRT_10189 [Giardia muris]|eukprot:TNJ26743.1 hypothetical protein GMRT_10189 [Giardia muris]